MVGIIDVSTTRKPSRPYTLSSALTTANVSRPILQVPIGWKIVLESRSLKIEQRVLHPTDMAYLEAIHGQYNCRLRIGQGMAEDRWSATLNRSSPTVKRILKTLIVLGLLKEGSTSVITPPRVAELTPAIIVVDAANIDHVVDGTCPRSATAGLGEASADRNALVGRCGRASHISSLGASRDHRWRMRYRGSRRVHRASSNKTLRCGSAERRCASTQPAEAGTSR